MDFEHISTGAEQIRSDITHLRTARNRGELGTLIATIVLRSSPHDIQQMRNNFSEKIRNVSPEYRDRLEAKITEHLLGSWQTLRLMQQQGVFILIKDPVPGEVNRYWDMVAVQCSGEGDDVRLRFLKFLIAAFSMFEQH